MTDEGGLPPIDQSKCADDWRNHIGEYQDEGERVQFANAVNSKDDVLQLNHVYGLDITAAENDK